MAREVSTSARAAAGSSLGSTGVATTFRYWPCTSSVRTSSGSASLSGYLSSSALRASVSASMGLPVSSSALASMKRTSAWPGATRSAFLSSMIAAL